jgi:hypothetical protein
MHGLMPALLAACRRPALPLILASIVLFHTQALAAD